MFSAKQIAKQMALTTSLVIVISWMTAIPSMAVDHPGNISTSETWLAADNPHNIISHVTVQARWVYWGTMSQMAIWENTWDELDDEAKGLIDFIPHANEFHDYVISGVDDDDDIPGAVLPSRTEMFQNHPNPFNPSAVISFDLHKDSPVQLPVYDISGARIATLVNGMVAAGRHDVLWNGTDDSGRSVSSGVYLYRFQSGDVSETKRMMLVK